MTLNILVAPNGLKECISAREAADAIAAGVRRAMPDARITSLPMIDGGEGTTEALVALTGGTRHPCTVTDPLGRPLTATVGILGGAGPRTAVIEIAAAAGLRLVRPGERDVVRATSCGVGELIRAALDLGIDRLVVGCGDSGVNDGGAGLARALGARLLDKRGEEIGTGVADLLALDRIDLSGLDPRLARVRIDAAVNWQNALLGPHGVTRTYGPQKGAAEDQLDMLERALATYARCIREATGRDVTRRHGAGASGGIGATLAGICGATLHPRFELLADYLDLDAHLAGADLVITAEGALDWQTPRGKVPAEIGRRAKALGIPVIALAATTADRAEATLACGVTAFGSIVRGPSSREACMADAVPLLQSATEQMLRVFAAGMACGVAVQSRASRWTRLHALCA